MATLRIALRNVHRIFNTSAVSGRTTTVFRPQYGWVSTYFSTNIGNTQSLNIDLSNEESKRRLYNRLLYRSKQRGFLELDLVLGKWVEEHIHSMDENGIKALVKVLDLENPDLWKWLTGQEQPPEAVTVNPSTPQECEGSIEASNSDSIVFDTMPDNDMMFTSTSSFRCFLVRQVTEIKEILRQAGAVSARDVINSPIPSRESHDQEPDHPRTRQRCQWLTDNLVEYFKFKKGRDSPRKLTALH
ncbi:hypothetical protein GOBAR_AA33827 [Gossypium barbadense]|uniref:Succinate dehydrogenase assembly factor 2, mitochondrial n=1 Tax=Gossypium barbadense TaxID=3634 RepID=A0A2P5W702_GOSBA|nr:hypothetical protein GOBAR_AA33827 [Gossypium barbadense]